MEVVVGAIEGAISLGLVTGAAFTAAVGQMMLAVVLLAIAAGMLLRLFRRKRQRTRPLGDGGGSRSS